MNRLQESWDYSDTTHHRFLTTGLEIPTVTAGLGRRGTRCIQGSSDDAEAAYDVPVENAQLYAGAYVHHYAASGEGPVFGIGSSLYASGVAFLTVEALADRSLGVYLDGSLLGVTPAGVLTFADTGVTYQFIEVGVELSYTTGSVEVRLGSDTLMRLTNIQTQPSGLGLTLPNRLWLYPRDERRYDDLYANDGTGDRNNTFAGPVRIDAYFPEEDYLTPEFTRNTGDRNYANVDDGIPDEDTTYNYTTTSGALDLFEFGTLRARRADIRALNLLVRARRALPAGEASLQSMVRSGGLTTPLTAVMLTSGYAYYSDIVETNPLTASGWTTDEFEEAKWGYRRPL